MSAKLLRQSRLSKVFSKLFQKDRISEKNSAQNPPVGPESGASPANHLSSNAAPPAAVKLSALPMKFNPELPPETPRRLPATVTSKLKTFFRPRPKPVSPKNRQTPAKPCRLPNPIKGLGSWFKQLTTKRRPAPPPPPEPEWDIVHIKRRYWRQGTY